MRFTARSKAVGLLLIVCLQSISVTLVKAADCKASACAPKVTPAKFGQATVTCPEGFKLETQKDKQACVKRSYKPCPSGSNVKDKTKCCAVKTVEDCVALSGTGRSATCASDRLKKKVCEKFENAFITSVEGSKETKGRRLQSFSQVGNVNIKATRHSWIPILPQAGLTIDVAAPKPSTKNNNINIVPLKDFIPNLILPESAVTINVPEPDKKSGGQLNVQGSITNLIPNIIPILPEPSLSIEVPEKKTNAKLLPTVNLDVQNTYSTIDLSRLGPEKVVNVEIPGLPNFKDLIPSTSLEVRTNGPAPTIDLSHLGPSKTVDVTLSKIKMPQGPNVNIQFPEKETKYLDLTGLGPSKTVNVKLPTVEVASHDVNIDMTGKAPPPANVVIPGKGGSTEVNVKVPGIELPTRERKVTIDINKQNLNFKPQPTVVKNKTHVDVKLPDIDLTFGQEQPKDINIVIQAAKMNDTAFLKSAVPTTSHTTVDVVMPTIRVGKEQEDVNLVVEPIRGFGFKVPDSMKNMSVTQSTKKIDITLPKLLPEIPTEKGGNVVFQVPIVNPLGNSSKPSLSVDVIYEDKVTGGNQVLPNTAIAAASAVAAALNPITTQTCPTKCCKKTGPVQVDVCADRDVVVDVVKPTVTCPPKCYLNKKGDRCVCQEAVVAACPGGKAPCKVGGKPVCLAASEKCGDYSKSCTKSVKFSSC